MTRFVHLTDIHISHPAMEDPQRRADTAAHLRAAVEGINRLDPAPDFVLLSGDLVNHGDEPSYRLARELLAPLKAPLLIGLGNHDDRAVFHSVFSGHDRADPMVHEAVHGGLHVVTLDSLVPGRVGGALPSEQVEFLEAALARHPEMPKVVSIHHPPRLSHRGLPWASLDPESTAALAGALAGRNVAGVFSGHIHLNRVSLWRGAPLVVSNGLNTSVDVLADPDMVIVEGAGFALCDWNAEEGLTALFVPLAPERRVLGTLSIDRLRSFA
ncbi:MAG: metallophosphoesterase [Pikeienuella sp.]|uniref:metallophosphoesterase n=1 Tax=Pikeienuella sp. TaxID=2831957 RepID=UPI00391B13F6